MTAIGGKAVVHQQISDYQNLNDRFHPKRTFRTQEIGENDRQLTAKSGRGKLRYRV